MSLWSSIIAKLKEVIRKMIGSKTIEDTLHIAPVISMEMENAIRTWSDMYRGKAPWLHEPDVNDPTRIVSLGLPAMIASEKARMVVLEMNSEITTPTEEVEVPNPDYTEPIPDQFGNIMPTFQKPTMVKDKPIGPTDRAVYLNEQYTKLKSNLRRQLEYGIAKGGLVIKPYVVTGQVEGTEELTYNIEFDYIQADSFYPLAFNASGQITEAAFLDSKVEKNTIYRRLEYHKWTNNSVRIINKAFKSNIPNNKPNIDLNSVDLGKEVPLSDVPEWSALQEDTTIKNVSKPLFAYFRMPEANTIDTTSPLGVSGYSRAVSLIKDADIQYSTLLWEYEAGQMAIDIDRDALMTQSDNNGNAHTTLGHLQQRLYRFVDISQTGDTYQPYSPALRDSQYIQGLNTILMRIEDVCALSRGTLSDAAAEARTATELKILKQRSFSANAEIQKALETTLKDVIYIMNVYCDLYEITPEGEYDVNFEWDDSIITDVDTELGKHITLLQNGIESKKHIRMWYFGETERQAEQALAEINGESLQDEEEEMAMQTNILRQKQMGGNNM